MRRFTLSQRVVSFKIRPCHNTDFDVCGSRVSPFTSRWITTIIPAHTKRVIHGPYTVVTHTGTAVHVIVYGCLPPFTATVMFDLDILLSIWLNKNNRRIRQIIIFSIISEKIAITLQTLNRSVPVFSIYEQMSSFCQSSDSALFPIFEWRTFSSKNNDGFVSDCDE